VFVMQQARRHNPYPLTWEIPAGICCLVGLALAFGVHLGNGLAHLAAGHGWVWPASSDLISSLPAVLTGPGVDAVAMILAVEAVLAGVLLGAGVAAWGRWGPSRMKGMASPTEAEQVLGVGRLRKVAGIVRPDLHPRRRPLIGGRR